jgi:hypothetical protein
MREYVILNTRTKKHTKWHTTQRLNLLTPCMAISFLLLEQNSTPNGTPLYKSSN